MSINDKEDQQMKEYNAKKDIFWKLLFINAFISAYIIMNLSQYSWWNPMFTAIILILAVIGLVMGPSILYPKLKGVYGVFQDKKYLTEEDKVERAKAKVIYNLVVFIALFLLAGPIANAINLFLFHKNKTTDFILVILLSFGALVLSIYITEKKSKREGE